MIIATICGTQHTPIDEDPPGPTTCCADAAEKRRILVTVGLVVSTCLLSFTTDCLGIVLEINVSSVSIIPQVPPVGLVINRLEKNRPMISLL